jgi:phenylpropionate dioxygenase-like ring-hydroxylating dioxygenase large terminal subunit
MIFSCGPDHAVVGLMDPAHGPFVHRAWWWRSRRSIHEKEKRFEPAPLGFRMCRHAPSANSPLVARGSGALWSNGHCLGEAGRKELD